MDRVIHLIKDVPVMSVIQLFIGGCSDSQGGKVIYARESTQECARAQASVSVSVTTQNL
jgi:hypothetical protein